MATITSANAVFTITVPGLYDSPQQLQGFGTDRAWATDALTLGEAVVGVDGKMSVAYTPALIKQTVTLQADSASRGIFNNIAQATRQTKDVYLIYGTISLPSTGEIITLYKGMLDSHKAMPDAAKTLQPIDYSITWERVTTVAA